MLMKLSRNLAAVLAATVLVSNAAAIAQDASGGGDAGSPATIAPMYGGQFKCTDGYDPDTDPSLHPDGQNPKIRMLVNAQAQQDHEKKLAADPNRNQGGDSSVKSSTPANNGASSAGTTADATKNGKGKDDKKNDDKKSAAKKSDADKKAAGDKKDDSEKKAEADKKDDAKTAGDKSKPKDKPPEVKEAYNPLKDAIFAIQNRDYHTSAALLVKLIAGDAKNLQAHYLLAISYVGLRQYQQASEQYNFVLKMAPNSKLAALATEGLKKISP